MATATGEPAPRDFGPALRAIPLGHTESVRKTLGESDVYLFAGITGDFSGVHVDEEFGKSTRFGGRIAHGALLVGFVSTVMARMTALLPPPGGVSSRYEMKFVAPRADRGHGHDRAHARRDAARAARARVPGARRPTSAARPCSWGRPS